MLFNLYANNGEYHNIDFNEVCERIEDSIHKGNKFIVEILASSFIKPRKINDMIDYSEFVDEFGEV